VIRLKAKNWLPLQELAPFLDTKGLWRMLFTVHHAESQVFQGA